MRAIKLLESLRRDQQQHSVPWFYTGGGRAERVHATYSLLVNHQDHITRLQPRLGCDGARHIRNGHPFTRVKAKLASSRLIQTLHG